MNDPRDLWAEQADEQIRFGRGFHWTESPGVMEYINSQISGDPEVAWVPHSIQSYMKDVRSPRVLSLGCGGGACERTILSLKPDARLLGIDFSPGAVLHAQRVAKESGLNIDYCAADLNVATLGRSRFDFVYASASIHHVERLEHLVEEIRRCLTTGGFLVAFEYIGPNRLQWTKAQVRAINEILDSLPERLKRSVSRPGEVKRSFAGPSPIAEMLEVDPTEAPRSEEIVDVVGQALDLVEYKPVGGTLLHMLLQDIAGNFDPAEEDDACILRLVCRLESEMIASGQLQDDFAFFVARKRDTSAAASPAKLETQVDLAKLQEEAERLRREVREIRSELEGRDRVLNGVLTSRSWRVTRPLRWLASVIRAASSRRDL